MTTPNNYNNYDNRILWTEDPIIDNASIYILYMVSCVNQKVQCTVNDRNSYLFDMMRDIVEMCNRVA